MEVSGRQVSVTQQGLLTILNRRNAESVTSLNIYGKGIYLASEPEFWPTELRGRDVYILADVAPGRGLWSSLIDRIVGHRNLERLALVGIGIGDDEVELLATRLRRLAILHLGGNNIGKHGAQAIARQLTRLTSLSIWGNRIGEPGSMAIAAQLTHLNSLNLSECDIGYRGLRAISDNLTGLSTLNVSNNGVGNDGAIAIAERLSRLTSLQVSLNEICDGGIEMIAGRLSYLTRLSAGYNLIGDAGGCAIAEHQEQLQELFLEGNRLSPLTVEALGRKLRNLSRISIAGNTDIRDIEPLAALPKLRSLDVSGTSVSDLSPFATRIADGLAVHLGYPWGDEGINVAGCPLVRPTEEIAKQGPRAVRNYFAELAAQGEDYIFEAKVLILGKGGAGKTSLLRRLYQPERELPKEDETTRGIDIHRHEFKGKNGQLFRVNVWDFGGQQIYHATHQFFLTKNSLYVLVDDTREDDKTIHDEAFKFWLEVVETLSDSSPLLIFQNEKGDRSKAIDQPGIQGRFSNVKAVHRGNLERLGSATPLKEAIEYYAQQLPHVGEPVPKKWVAIRSELEQLALKRPFISQDEYFSVYGRHLAFGRTKALHLSRYLHDLGVFLHFQDDPLLSKAVVLQNRWATEAVFRILDDEAIKARLGRFDGADCLRLWAASVYADMHFELRGLMEKFELCYRLDASQPEQWLAPQLLSPSKPPELGGWARPDDLTVRFQYAFLPKGLVSRIMVRQHRFVSRLERCWAHGAYFEWQGTEALVEETRKGNEIELRARGPEHKALLSVLSSDLEALNDSFKGLQGRVEKMVPCLCATCQATTEPEMFKRSVLVQRKLAGKKLTIECHRSGEDVSLLALLDGLKLDQLPKWATKPNSLDSTAEDSPRVPKRRLSKRVRNVRKQVGIKTIKIFLASSAELSEDRDEFERYFRQQNDRLREEGIYLEIVRWESHSAAMSRTRLQDEYNRDLRDCDIVVCLFKTKVGTFTQEEFDEAWRNFSTTGKPHIFTFFRDFNLSGEEIKEKQKEIESLHAFQQKLSDLGHFYTKYNDAEHLKRQFRDQLAHSGLLK